MENTNKDSERQKANRTQQDKKGGTGQQTGGVRGQKLEKGDKQGYRSSEQKRQRGNHGGNR
jgi:hypothetical protein